MPNSGEAVAAVTARYVVSLAQLEANLAQYGLAEVFDVSHEVRVHVPTFWGTLEGCDRA